eukprot:TRINITY_DN19771_c0_g1_i2.p1 TRINITY_DN19771_c0_g1~~TRINITY_DN19771_c0_g1_i2.p1  ORF type:complete len:176 (+),score=16.35 TRINITY_DN19771_c0_g1_i2:360-887(+)
MLTEAPQFCAPADTSDRRKQLGEGGFGKVMTALQVQENTDQDIDIAVKTIKGSSNPMLMKMAARECATNLKLKQKPHANILRVFECGSADSLYGIEHVFFMERARRDNLYEVAVRRGKPQLDVETLKRYTREMASAIKHLHELRIVHRDIKPSNFLFSVEGHLKLADFGASAYFH